MKKGLLMVLVLALLAAASTANAEPFGEGKFQFDVGLRQMTVYVVDTVALQIFFPPGFNWGGGTLSGLHDPRVMGVGADFKFGLSDDVALNWGGAFGWGNEKTEVAGPGAYDINWKASGFSFHAGMNRTVNLSSIVGLYFGPGFEWARYKAKTEQTDAFFVGSESWDSKATNAISLTGRVGVQAMMGDHFGVDANLGQKWSKVSFKEDVGGDEVKFSSWVTSLAGSAGFVFYIN